MIDLHLSRELINDVYYPYLFQYEEPLEVYYGGSGSGKSVFIMQKLLVKALNEKRKVLVMRKVQTSQKESCWRLCLEVLKQWKIYNKVKIRISDYTIELPNGSILLFKGMDDTEKIKSIVDPTDIWLEECNEFSEDDFVQLTLRNRAKINNLQIFVSFNPVSKTNWVYKRWFSKLAVENPFILKSTYKDNKFLTPQYVKRLEALINTNPYYYKVYTLGEFASLEKLIFNNWEIKEFDYQEISKAKQSELLVGLDWGFSTDPTALIASILVDNDLYIFKEYYETGLTNPQIANVIKSMGFSKSIIIADSAEPKSIQELKDNGIIRIRASEKGPDSIRQGIQKLLQLNIYIHPSCMQTITEFENYSWKKDRKTGEYINEPIDMFNHLIDSLRYSLQCTKKKLKTLSKQSLGV